MNKSRSTVRRVVTTAWLGTCGLQFVIWTLMCLIGRHLADPFWLWTVVGGLLVGAVWAVPAKDGAHR